MNENSDSSSQISDEMHLAEVRPGKLEQQQYSVSIVNECQKMVTLDAKNKHVQNQKIPMQSGIFHMQKRHFLAKEQERVEENGS